MYYTQYVRNYVGVSVVREHYYKLLKDFPLDHMITLSMLCQITETSDKTVDKIISCCSPQEGNEKILEYLILDIKSNEDLVGFCNAIEKIVGDDSAALKSFINGETLILNTLLPHTYVYINYACVRT